jgi:hypothetical protein
LMVLFLSHACFASDSSDGISANIERFLLQTMTSNFCLMKQWIWQYNKI